MDVLFVPRPNEVKGNNQLGINSTLNKISPRWQVFVSSLFRAMSYSLRAPLLG